MLQYITDPLASTPIVKQVEDVISGGCRWIQVAMPDATDSEIEEVIKGIMPLCIEKEAFLILESRADLAKTLNVGGVYLHKRDMLPSQARVLLGAGAVIGVEAESYEDVNAVKALDVDYVGIPHEKMIAISAEMEEKEVTIARVATGITELAQVAPAFANGANAIAVSGSIANAEDIKKKTEEYLKHISLVNG